MTQDTQTPAARYDALKNAAKISGSGKILIGIDPDVEKSGFAAYFKDDKMLILKNLTFFELYTELVLFRDEYLNKLEVYVEGGWLNGGNWHLTKYDTLRTAAKKGHGVGRNHETGIKIVEMCHFLGITVYTIRPTASKILEARIFNQITKYKSRTNQEQRDAAMLVWGR